MSNHVNSFNNNYRERRHMASNQIVGNDVLDEDLDEEEYEYKDCCCISGLLRDLNLIQVNLICKVVGV